MATGSDQPKLADIDDDDVAYDSMIGTDPEVIP